jgi:glycosyltransferase involved in cell wall biosynthesis
MNSESTHRSNATLVLFTKQYPFGHAETYLNNEIRFLDEAFKEVILVPVDAYKFGDVNSIVKGLPNTRVFKINESKKTVGFSKRILRTFQCLRILLNEILNGREPWMHIRKLRFCLTYLKVGYGQAEKLNEFIGSKSTPVVLYSYWLQKGTLAGIFYKRYFSKHSKLINRAHSSDLYHRDWNDIIQMDNAPFYPFEYFKVSESDHVYSISDHGVAHLKKVFPYFSERFSVARLAVKDSGKLNPFNDASFFRIVTCSGITPNKRVYFLPEILHHLKDLHVEWVHLGEGKGQNLEYLQAEIDKYQVQDRITIKGRMDNSEIFKYYENEQVNLIVNLSKAEGIPVSLMEAISFGIPGIVTNTVGNPEVIDETCGYIVDVDFSAERIADLIRGMYQNHDLQVELRKCARHMFENRYHAEINYSQFVEELKTYE